MDKSDSDHSISSNISIPQWMRPRIQDRFDTEISTLSPPNQDDSFFYIPYSKITKTTTNSAGPSIVSASSDNSKSSAISFAAEASSSNTGIIKHTQPCLKFLGESKTMDINDLTGFIKDEKSSKPIKSFGTDDGFKSEAAQCGHSVVQVAQQMIADRLLGRPSKMNSENDTSKLGDSEVPYLKQRVRRGSKSLPASPLSTPDSTPQIQRKNRFFTGAFVESSEEASKFPGSWLVAGLLGVHRETLSESQSDLSSDTNNNASVQSKQVSSPDSVHQNNSSSTILQSLDKAKPESAAEDKEKNASPLHESRSAASLVKMGTVRAEPNVKKPRPKPSELREMNFWSPTSM